MKIGNVLVEQITKEGYVLDGYDESLSPSEIYSLLSCYFQGIQRDSTDSRFYFGEYKKHKYAIRCKNVTYLGNPHPHFKKRIQIADDLYDFYNFAIRNQAKPILLGIYSYHDNRIFVDFKIDTYIEKKAHNSSAHIYVSDLVAATEDGYFQKTDYFGNTVTAIRPDVLGIYLDELFGFAEEEKTVVTTRDQNTDKSIAKNKTVTSIPDSVLHFEDKKVDVLEEKADNLAENASERFNSYANIFKKQIAPKIKAFFTSEEREWKGIDCYQKMITANYRNKYQPEWVGFFLEFEFEKYLSENNLNYLITYAQDKSLGGIDLDLFFPTIESYGDLKAHSEESRGIQGNDWSTIFGIINGQDEKSHIYYIVCEHSTEKDSLHDYEVTRYWNTAQNKENLMSYATRMKNRIRLKKLYILDINYSNKEHLTMFRQGLNSNGRPREPKIMIEQDNLSYFIIDEMTL